MTYLTTCGAMTLQGPHQVAKKSTTIRPFSPRAESKSALLFGRARRQPFVIRLVECAFSSGGRRARARRAVEQGRRRGTHEVRLWTPWLDMVAEKLRRVVVRRRGVVAAREVVKAAAWVVRGLTDVGLTTALLRAELVRRARGRREARERDIYTVWNGEKGTSVGIYNTRVR